MSPSVVVTSMSIGPLAIVHPVHHIGLRGLVEELSLAQPTNIEIKSNVIRNERKVVKNTIFLFRELIVSI
jgi:hypothetical protein